MFVNKCSRYLNLSKNYFVIRVRTLADETSKSNFTTVNEKDVALFGSLSPDWWDSNGPMRALHSLNALRVPFIRDGLLSTREVPTDRIKTTRVLEGFKILDVGCGGGFLTENLARLHAQMTSIDPGKEIIQAAQMHLCEHNLELAGRVQYINDSIENFSKTHMNEYDAVILSEVVEHVNNVPKFVSAAIDTLKPGGSVFVTTPNRTNLMYVLGIFVSENILNIVPRGTHEWDKFITPLEMQRILESLNCSVTMVHGSFYEFWRNTWRWVPSTQFCYAMHAVKRPDETYNDVSSK